MDISTVYDCAVITREVGLHPEFFSWLASYSSNSGDDNSCFKAL